MEDITKSIIEKISSYNLFNHLLPGIIFCYLVDRFTNISIATDSILENLFIYYFVGVLIGRFSSLVVEPILMKVSVKNKKEKGKEAYIRFAPYENYIEVSENNGFIKVLNESCNTYRSFISVFLLVMICKIYERYLRVAFNYFGSAGQDIKIIVFCLGMSLLFVMSYKKQVDYIRRRVEKYMNDKKIKEDESKGESN